MRVAHICPQIRFAGGTETFVKEVSSSMNNLGITSAIYSSETDFPPRLISAIGVAYYLARRAIRDGFDTLVFHRAHGASRFLRKIKSACYFHESDYDNLSGGTIMRSVYKNVLGQVERRIQYAACNSQYTASRLKSILPKATIRTIYPGRKKITVQSARTPSEPTFCYCHSRLHPRKNQSFLLDVFDGFSYNLVISGGTWDRKFWKYQRELVQRAEEMPNVQVIPNIADVEYVDHLKRCSAFLFPARNEPFGMVLLDALSCQKPIVALESGASSEVLSSAGLLCEEDVEKWRTAIKDVLCKAELRTSLIQRAVARADSFSWDRTAQELVEFLIEI